MINKIIKILSVGRFEDYNAVGDLEFKKMTVVYGENGRGKTTLSAIFHSLKNNQPIFILERSTLGNTDKPNIEIRAENDNYIFKDGQWNKDHKNIEIFDSTFINQNIFSGENVEHDHKKNLYHFVVGEGGVKIAQNVNILDSQIREKGNDITKKENDIQKYVIGSSISIDNFINLPAMVNVDDLINKKEKEVEVIKKSSMILAKPLLQKLILPEYPKKEIDTILNLTLEGVLKEAEEKTKEHIRTNLDFGGEAWIEKGLSYIKDENCPFCGQNCESVDLINAYKGYFNKEYNTLKDNIFIEINAIKNLFSESALIHVQNNYNSNSSLADFWSQYILVEMSSLLFSEIQSAWKNLRDLTVEHLKSKNLSPLDQIKI